MILMVFGPNRNAFAKVNFKTIWRTQNLSLDMSLYDLLFFNAGIKNLVF